ncbi:MAG: hybrid sensor histidine kinase/response regulator, partial [Deltaproteobacteria bacterium]
MTMAGKEGKVLVIDDEAVIREGCQRILTKNGWEVLTAPDGNAGLSLAEDPSEIEVVLLDLKMPGISGMEVLERLLERDPSLPVVVITGYATVDSAVEAMKKGAYDFIAKPFTPDQLRLVVERAAERRRLEREAERLRREAARSLKDVATEKGRVLTIINSMADGVLVTDHEGRVALTNPAATRLLGL